MRLTGTSADLFTWSPVTCDFSVSFMKFELFYLSAVGPNTLRNGGWFFCRKLHRMYAEDKPILLLQRYISRRRLPLVQEVRRSGRRRPDTGWRYRCRWTRLATISVSLFTVSSRSSASCWFNFQSLKRLLLVLPDPGYMGQKCLGYVEIFLHLIFINAWGPFWCRFGVQFWPHLDWNYKLYITYILWRKSVTFRLSCLLRDVNK